MSVVDRKGKKPAARALMKNASIPRVHGDEAERLAKRSGVANPRAAQKEISKKAPRGPVTGKPRSRGPRGPRDAPR